MKNEQVTIVATGAVIGLLAAILVFFGNPANMGLCIACFLRDTAGGLGLHAAKAVQYIRPEISGLVLGALAAAYLHGEFAPKGGSSPLTRFVLGFFAMIGCLMFLGCPFRMLLRIAGGDLNAIVGLVGFAAGIYAGIFFLNRGYSLKRTYKMTAAEGSIMSVIAVVLLVLLVAAPAFIHFTKAGGGPGAKHAAVAVSLGAALVVGYLTQRTRFCMIAGLRDFVLFRETKMLWGFVAVIAAAACQSCPRWTAPTIAFKYCAGLCNRRRLLQAWLCCAANCAYRCTVERAGPLFGRLCLRAAWRLPDASAGAVRRGQL